MTHLSSSGGAEVGHVCRAGDDVDGECDEQGADGGIDGAEEGEGDGEEPDGEHHRDAAEGSEEQALGVVHADELLPHEVEGRHRESDCDELHSHGLINQCTAVDHL